MIWVEVGHLDRQHSQTGIPRTHVTAFASVGGSCRKYGVHYYGKEPSCHSTSGGLRFKNLVHLQQQQQHLSIMMILLFRRVGGLLCLWVACCDAFVSTTTTAPHYYDRRPCRLRLLDSTTSQDFKGETLYEILGASPDASRAELKKHYSELAKKTHPDALIGQNVSEATSSSSSSSSLYRHDFGEIALAYKTLSNTKQRKRYDRSLQADSLKQNIEKVADDITQAAAPQINKVFEEYAVPFLRRTTATTVASVTAVAKDIQNQQKQSSKNGSDSVDLKSAVSSAIQAGQRAGKLIDGMELLEKSKALVERCVCVRVCVLY